MVGTNETWKALIRRISRLVNGWVYKRKYAAKNKPKADQMDDLIGPRKRTFDHLEGGAAKNKLKAE